MRLVRLIYCSTFQEDDNGAALTELVEKAARKNRQLGLSGLLFYGAGKFLQVLEGDGETVNDLYCKLVTDPRHTQLRLLDFREVSQRRFDGWSMAHTTLSELLGQRVGRESLFRYSAGVFDPYHLNPEAALAFLLEIGKAVEHDPAPLVGV